MFNETEWLRLLFLLADTHTWLDDLVKEAMLHLPLTGKKKLIRKMYFLTVPVLAHILERHYYKINRYPQSGKFTIFVVDILQYLRDASAIHPIPLSGCLNFQRILYTNQTIGFDRKGQPATVITVITDAGGKIITAFPGKAGNHLEYNTGQDLR